jgi:hypothetical protein
VLESAPSSFAALFRVEVCLASILTLLSLPLNTAHNFHQHFRTERVRREIASQTFLSVAKESSAKVVNRSISELIRFVLIDPTRRIDYPASFEVPPLCSLRVSFCASVLVPA